MTPEGGCQFGKDTREQIQSAVDYISDVQTRLWRIAAALLSIMAVIVTVFTFLVQGVEAQTTSEIEAMNKAVEHNRENVNNRREMAARLEERLKSIDNRLGQLNDKMEKIEDE
jgi:uncharacterized protein HemX